jgi:negative regulator of sigma E activity
MSEQEQMSQLSALFDNELPPAEAELVIRRALKDPALRARWDRYALIGACVRNEPIHASMQTPDVADRVRRQLAAETDAPPAGKVTVAQYPGERRTWSQFGRGALGGAIAAGVATVALILVNSTGSQGADPVVQMAAADVPQAEMSEVQPVVTSTEKSPQVVAAVDSPAIPYSTPVVNSVPRISGPLAENVVAHSEVAASAGLVPRYAGMSDYDITRGTVRMTDAEISRLR